MSSLWLSAACTADIAHKYHFFDFQQKKSSTTKLNFIKTSDSCQKIRKARLFKFVIRTLTLITQTSL